MAEYAGLEIRIGGNTTKLTNALKASTKSAAELQSRIRQITKAMQFDPTDLKNIETRIKITGDRMQSLQSKAQITKEAMRQLGDSVVKLGGEPKKIRDIAENTHNLSLKAKQADERFVRFGKTLAEIYEAWNKVARNKGADYLMDKLGGFTQSDADRLMSSTTLMRDFVSELKEAQSLRSDPMYSGPGGIITDADIEKLKQFKALNFHDMFKRGLELDDVIEEAERLGVVIEESAVSNVRELQKTFKETQRDKEAFDKALQFEQMGTDLQRMNSEAESLSQTIRRLDDGMTKIGSTSYFQDAEARIRGIDAALEKVDKDMERTKEAMVADPGNIELAARYFTDLQQKAELSKEKVALLNKEIELLDYSGASEAVKQHQDLAKWVEESAEAARTAQKELSNQRAEVANLSDQAATLKQTIDTMKGDSTLATYSDGVLQWQKKVEKLNKALDELSSKQRLVNEGQEQLAEAQGAFDKAKKEAEDYERQLEEVTQAYERLGAEYAEVYNDPTVDYDTKKGMYDYLNQLQAEIERIKAAYKGAQRNVDEFGRKLDAQKDVANTAQKAYDEVSDEVDELREAISELEKTPDVRLFQNPGEGIEEAEQELARLRTELGKASAEEKRLASAYNAAETENELAKTAQALRETSQKANEAQTDLKKLQEELSTDNSSVLNPSTVKSIGMTLSATVTPAITALGYKMVDASSSVDSAYRDMRKTVQGTEDQFEHLRKAAIEFSRTHVTSADQILQIEAIGGELGVATEDLETFAEVISNLDVASNLDTEEAATALGHLANILHLTKEDYVSFSDALVRLGNNGASTETEIVNIAERIGSMGSIVGMSGSDILAFASSIASTGQNAEAAGTAISRTMSFMETAVAAAGGTMDTSFEAINAAVEEGGDKLTVFASLAGMTADEFAESWESGADEMAAQLQEQLDGAKDKLQMIADVAHMSADEFAKTWKSDPTKALQAFIVGLNDVEQAEGSADKVLQDLGITAVRQKQAIEGLMQTVGGLDKNLTMSRDAWNGVSDEWGQAGDAANEAAKKAEGFSGQMQILRNMGQNFLSELGEGAVPWIKMFSGILSEMSATFSTLSVDTKKWIVAAGGIGAAIGPLMSMMGTIGVSRKEVQEWFKETTSGMNLVKLAFKYGSSEIDSALNGTLSTMSRVKLVGMDLGASLMKGIAAYGVIGAIALVVAGLATLYERYKDHEAATKGLADAIEGIGKASEEAAVGTEEMATSVFNLVSESSNYESRLADLAKTIEDSNRQYGNLAGSLDSYAETIERLGGKADLTEDEAYKLEAALLAVNDACGTTYDIDEYGNIIDTQTGKIEKNTKAILDNINLRQQQAIIDYYSDDYAKAVGEQEDARQRVSDLAEEYRNLRTEAGKQEWIDNYIEKTGRADLAEQAFSGHLDRTKTALDQSKTEFQETSEVVTTLEGKISGAQEKIREANKAVEEAAKAQEELNKRSDTVTSDVTGNMKRMSDAVSELGGSDSSFNSMAESLDAIHVSAEEMNDVDMSRLASAFSDTGSSMAEVIAALEEGGVHMDTWNAALEQAPGAAENMSSITAAAFDEMYEVAGGDLNKTMTLIAGLDMVQVGDKTFYIGDNGTILDEQGKIYDINEDIATIPDEVLTTYYVDDKDALKKAQDAKAKLTEVDKQNAKPTIEVKDNASKPTEEVQSKLKATNDYTARPTASLIDLVTSKLRGIDDYLVRMNGRVSTVTVKTIEKTEKHQATGGLNSRPVIPRHASGYIATGPTITNQGWIGEDGIEAVANWATGGAVVPLTNKRYMLPIADAIADGMAMRIGGDIGGKAPINITINGVAGPDETARAIERTLRLYGYV